MKPSKLIGKKAFIKDDSFYAGHWGIIVAFDGENYTISKGSIGDDLAPIFTRDEFTIPRDKKEK